MGKLEKWDHRLGQGPETGVLPGIKEASVFASTEEETGLSDSDLHPLERVKL